MGKLIELLNEYSKEIGYFNEEDLRGQVKARILSKEFGFIKWLVENDKIDIEKFPQIMEYGDLESLLMYLSIQDEPIRFLCEILK